MDEDYCTALLFVILVAQQIQINNEISIFSCKFKCSLKTHGSDNPRIKENSTNHEKWYPQIFVPLH